MGKLKWVTKSVSFSCQDPPRFTQNISLPSAFRVARFRSPVSGPLTEADGAPRRSGEQSVLIRLRPRAHLPLDPPPVRRPEKATTIVIVMTMIIMILVLRTTYYVLLVTIIMKIMMIIMISIKPQGEPIV